MAIAPVPAFPFPRRPFSSITPFTYSDAMTHLELLEKLRVYAGIELPAEINKVLDDYSIEITDEVQAAIDLMIGILNDAVQQIINDSIEAQDSVVSGILSDPDSETRAVLDTLYPHAVVWDGDQYPPRYEGTTNIFIGPEDPGLAIETGDVWVNSNTTTNETVASEIMEPGSLLNSAVISATTAGERVYLGAGALTPIIGCELGAVADGGVRIPMINDKGDTRVQFGGGVRIPDRWNRARLNVIYSERSGTGTGDIRLQARAIHVTEGMDVFGDVEDLNHTITIDSHQERLVRVQTFTGSPITVTPGEWLNISVDRRKDLNSDTYPDGLLFYGVYLERIA